MITFDLNNEKILDSLEAILSRDGLDDLYIDLNEDLSKNVRKFFSISYFDHILTEEEYKSEKFVCYSNVANASDINLDEKFTKIMNYFLYIYNTVFDLNNDFVYIDNNSSIIKTKCKDFYIRNIINGLKERPLCSLVFVNLKLTVVFGYDLTHYFYFIDDSYFIEIREMILSTELFILEEM